MTQADIADFATWTEPETSFQVRYSLSLFHEIDMTVSEGYRRIPHGGIEIGGLLIGRRFPDGARIEAFRLIECEHAQGPSFKLSDRDVAGIRDQIERTPADPELGELEVLGWFIAHTRGPLQLTDAESRLFGELFPGPGKMTVLVKPEKFKPTLFSFLVRRPDGAVKSNGSDEAIILPLPGRAARVQDDAPAAPIDAAEPELPPARAKIETPQAVKAPEPAIGRVPELLPEPPIPIKPAPVSIPQSVKVPSLPPPPETPAPAPFEWEFDRTSMDPPPPFSDYGQSAGRKVRRDVTKEGSRTGSLVAAIFVAAVLGAGAGFWFYEQMPPPLIQLTVEPEPTGVIVSWPPEQTAEASRAFVRVNNGPLIELPLEAKTAGRYRVQAELDNLKVEIIAQHYLHDSRGIVRYIQPVAVR